MVYKMEIEGKEGDIFMKYTIFTKNLNLGLGGWNT